jgi:demethylmenaquinone methyltransferase / 2-methoxy-6-polyprenyl-1,4-benzoquinol methylase
MINKDPDNVKEMFNRISPRYVLINTLMTLGQDRRWRKELIRLCSLKDGDNLLDVATGTGDVIIEVLKSGIKTGSCTGVDFSAGMLNIAKSRFTTLLSVISKQDDKISVKWIEADALQLPLDNNFFDTVTSAYLMRNAVNVEHAFSEQFRVLKAGGRAACLDTSPPVKTILAPFINIYLTRIIPLIGSLVSGNKSAYTYLPETTRAFKSADEMVEIMKKAGFINVCYKKYMFGTMAIHWGEKPSTDNLKNTNKKQKTETIEKSDE